MLMPDFLHSILSRPIAVIGLGKSHTPLLEFLCAQGARHMTARDRRPFEQLPPAVQAFRARGVSFRCGEDYLADLVEPTLFRTPGLRPDTPPLAEARARGAMVLGECDLVLRLCPAETYAITGSDGKTTTTTLVSRLLRAAGQATCTGGNIGASLLPLLPGLTASDAAVLELSSFQLMDMEGSADHAAWINLTENHLNWHRDMAEYAAAKRRILAAPHCVLNADDPTTAAEIPLHPDVTLFSVSQTAEALQKQYPMAASVTIADGEFLLTEGKNSRRLCPLSASLLPGLHNCANLAAALALTCRRVGRDDAIEALRGFCGVEHRMEQVCLRRGVRYINSSIDSTPARTAATLAALAPDRPLVIAGGADKGLSFEGLADTLIDRAAAVFLTGDTAGQIYHALISNKQYNPTRLPVSVYPDLAGALHAAAELARPGDTVVLSPACTSFDRFRDFEERGQLFRELVRALPD